MRQFYHRRHGSLQIPYIPGGLYSNQGKIKVWNSHPDQQIDNLKDITAEDLLQKISDYDAVIVRGRTKLTPEVLAAATKLKVAGRAGVGVDNINLEAAKSKGIVVVNSPLATTIAVAELTLGLMLSLIRDIPRADAGMKEGNWLKKDLRGTEINGKTLGSRTRGRTGVAE